MTYVGQGGNYTQDVTYTFAGEGAGEFNLVSVPTGCKCSVWLCAGGVVLLLLPLLWLSLLVLGTETTTTSHVRYIRPNGKAYDCEAGYDNRQRGWSVAKKEWCCHKHGRGCAQGATHSAIDCMIHGTPQVALSWPAPKRQFCCQHFGSGCGATTKAPDPNCAVGGPMTWSPGKKKWCCTHHHVGCTLPPQTPPPAQSVRFDCDAGYSNWLAGWSYSKKTWCCYHHGRACPTTPTPTHHTTVTAVSFDCNAGFQNWLAGWSAPKKAWCCSHGGRGCMTPTTSLPFDCNAGFSNWQKGWSSRKKAFCCQSMKRGCPR